MWKPGQLVTVGFKLCRVVKQDEEYMEIYKKYFSHLPRPKTKLPEDCYLVTLAWNIKHPTIKKAMQRRRCRIKKSIPSLLYKDWAVTNV